jgi:hypothetical protein
MKIDSIFRARLACSKRVTNGLCFVIGRSISLCVDEMTKTCENYSESNPKLSAAFRKDRFNHIRTGISSLPVLASVTASEQHQVGVQVV